jgi:hypothetical protein
MYYDVLHAHMYACVWCLDSAWMLKDFFMPITLCWGVHLPLDNCCKGMWPFYRICFAGSSSVMMCHWVTGFQAGSSQPHRPVWSLGAWWHAVTQKETKERTQPGRFSSATWTCHLPIRSHLLRPWLLPTCVMFRTVTYHSEQDLVIKPAVCLTGYTGYN